MKKELIRSSLARDKYPQLSFFTADIFGCSPKLDRHSMEHPMFIISKGNCDKERIEYTYGDTVITIIPSTAGYATIWDKDILIYAVSQLIDAMNKGREVNRTIRLTTHSLLMETQRSIGGAGYDGLKEALTRLRGTTITTNMISGGKRRARGFGLIDEWEVIEKDANGRMMAIEITLSRWLFNAITSKEVLTLNRDYFRLKGGLERRLYELARKHCGNQEFWSISLDKLYIKSGSQSSSKEFRRMLREAVAVNGIPDYNLELDVKNGNLIIFPKQKRLVGG